MTSARFTGHWSNWDDEPGHEFREADFAGAPPPPAGSETCVSDEEVARALGVDTSRLHGRWKRWKLPTPRKGLHRWNLYEIAVWISSNDPWRFHLRP